MLAFTAGGRLDFPAPLLLIAVGVAASYLPGVPEVHLEPEVVLFGLLPPLLYAAAIQTSLVDFNANRRAILLLSVGLVVFTTLGVGVVVHALIPGISWPAAFAIGAVVAPPDAVAATAIAGGSGCPAGSSRSSRASRCSTTRPRWSPCAPRSPRVGGVTVLEVGRGLPARRRWRRPSGFVASSSSPSCASSSPTRCWTPRSRSSSPFVAYVAAEEIHASGVIAVVVAGLLLGHKAPVLQTAQSRIAERINWRTIAFVLENTVFLLIGLQAGWIVADVSDSDPVHRPDRRRLRRGAASP